MLYSVGMRAGDVASLRSSVSSWQKEYGTLSSRVSSGEIGVSVGTKLTIPPNWSYGKTMSELPPSLQGYSGVSKLTPTVVESVDLYLQGFDVATVGLKRAKQIAPSTVQSHLVT